MTRRAEAIVIACASCAATLSGCTGEQSVLDPKGAGADGIHVMATVLFVGAAVVFAIVLAAMAMALLGPDRLRASLAADRAVVVGGIVFPAIVLTALLAYGVLTMAPVSSRQSPVRVMVEGKQWWWRVRYDLDDRTRETANEIRIPVGRPVEFALTSADVIHSFWVPNLAGKVDMIPGRTTRLTAMATQPGVMRGQCAEFCGGPHGLMSLRVIAMAPEAFDAWVARDRRRERQTAGHQLFMSVGCGACHSIEGTSAAGRIGPDLTDVGGRASLAAETLPNSSETIMRWITSSQSIKPGNAMPEFKHLTAQELAALAAYLTSLK